MGGSELTVSLVWCSSQSHTIASMSLLVHASEDVRHALELELPEHLSNELVPQCAEHLQTHGAD